MVDVRDGVNPLDAEIIEMLRGANKDFFLLANKVDSNKHESAANEFYALGVDKVYDISALMGRKIGDFLDQLTKDFQLKENAEDEDKDVQTDVIESENFSKEDFDLTIFEGAEDKEVIDDILENINGNSGRKDLSQRDVTESVDKLPDKENPEEESIKRQAHGIRSRKWVSLNHGHDHSSQRSHDYLRPGIGGIRR